MSRGLIRAKDIVVDDVLDRIYKAYISHRLDELSLQDGWLLERMEYADAKIREGGQASRSVNLIKEMQQFFKHHVVGDDTVLSTRTIENDIARAKRFFLSARPREEKEYGKGKYIEWGEKMLHKYEEAGDSLAWNMLYKELIKVNGFLREDIELPEYDSVQPPPLMVVTDATDIGVPAIDDLDNQVRILSMPKKEYRNNETLDVEDAEVADGSD